MYVYIYIHIVHIVYILYLYIHFMYVIYIIYALAEQKCSLYLVLLGRFGYLTTFHKLSYSFFHKHTVFHP